MKTIPITQFLRPNGEPRDLVCDVSDDVASLYGDCSAYFPKILAFSCAIASRSRSS